MSEGRAVGDGDDVSISFVPVLPVNLNLERLRTITDHRADSRFQERP